MFKKSKKNINENLETKTSSAAASEEVSVDEVMKKYDRESNTRIWEGVPKYIVMTIMALFSIFCIIMTLFITTDDRIRLTSFVGSALLMGYLVYPAKKGSQRVNHMPWYDIIIMVAGAGAFFYYCFNASDIIARVTHIYSYEIIIGLIGLLALMELCRRSVGVPILVVAGAFMLYAWYYFSFTKHLGPSAGGQYLIYNLFYKTTGILTTPINVCSKYIVVFIIFGAFLERTGISEYFIKLANSIAGGSSGGPAKVAVISSALCGMVSGSSVGNTVTTGSVTIPMMKKTGYKPEFAGAVEAASSTGGQIMPPIMGAAAFLMIDYLGAEYSRIITYAILPAVLYFAGIFITVHLEAKKLGLRGIPRAELPSFLKLQKQIYLLIPLIVLVWLVSSNTYTMAFSAAIAILLAIAIGLVEMLRIGVSARKSGNASAKTSLVKETAVNLGSMIFNSFANGAKSCISVIAACGMAGCVAGSITMTGLGSQLINAVLKISGDHIFIALFLTMLCCIVLGMGVPTTANFCIMATTCAPILIEMGIDNTAAYFFVFYFGIVADITPPVALAAYAGSAIAKSNPMKTAINATKLAIAAFIVPYIFAMNPVMLLMNEGVLSAILVIVTSLLGIFGIAVCLNGHLFTRVIWPLRIAILAGGLAMLVPGLATDAIGFVVVAAVVLYQYLTAKNHTPVNA
ncbi:MAG: TRAP transporter permease [Bacillota bacterium]|nr:TRAP transporter permease [Bacillota bacterium]